MRHLIISFDVSIIFSSYYFIIQHQTVIQFWSSTDSINSKLQQTTNPKTSCSNNSKLLQIKPVSRVAWQGSVQGRISGADQGILERGFVCMGSLC